MKSEERHQLLQNDLQVVTTRTVGFFESHVQRHVPTMIAVLCGVLLCFGVVTWWNQSSQSENAAGWTKLDSANSLEEFGDVVDKFKGKPPGQWAQLQIAEKTLQSAMPLMFTDRDIAVADLKRSREGFDSLLQDKSVPPVIRERALWGLALTLETGCNGDTSKPIEAYERLLSDFPDSIFKTVAEERIRSLKKPSSREFYTWFSKENPKPPEPSPRDYKTDGMRIPGINMPGDEPDDFKPNLPAPSRNSDDAPEGTENKDGEATPGDKPDAEKSANPDKPVGDDQPPAKEPQSGTEKPTEKN
jgi:hypothetical protein